MYTTLFGGELRLPGLLFNTMVKLSTLDLFPFHFSGEIIQSRTLSEVGC